MFFGWIICEMCAFTIRMIMDEVKHRKRTKLRKEAHVEDVDAKLQSIRKTRAQQQREHDANYWKWVQEQREQYEAEAKSKKDHRDDQIKKMVDAIADGEGQKASDLLDQLFADVAKDVIPEVVKEEPKREPEKYKDNM
jgi:transposase